MSSIVVKMLTIFPYFWTTECPYFWFHGVGSREHGIFLTLEKTSKIHALFWQQTVHRWYCCAREIAGQALLASCAYSGRVAVAYVSDYTRPHPSDSSKQLINLFVTVYECESTGEL